MSSSTGTGALSIAGLPPIDPSRLPASIRTGDATAQRAYRTALGFEQVLVNELSQQLVATATTPGSSGDSAAGTDGTTGSGSDGTGDGATGLMGSDPASSTYAQLLPDALTSGIMAGGGTGLALQLAKALDPAIGAKR